MAISTFEACPAGLTNSGTTVFSHRCSCGRPVSLAGSVADVRTTMRVLYGAPLRRQAQVSQRWQLRRCSVLLNQPRRLLFLSLAVIERLVTGGVAQHTRGRSGRSAPRWSALSGKTFYCFPSCLRKRRASNLTLDLHGPS